MLFPACALDSILRFDSDSRETEIIDLKLGVDGLVGIAYDGDNYWITTRYMDFIIKLDHNFHVKQKIPIPDSDLLVIYPFYQPFVMKNGIYIVPLFSKYGYVIDPETDKISRCNHFCHLDEIPRNPFSKSTQNNHISRRESKAESSHRRSFAKTRSASLFPEQTKT